MGEHTPGPWLREGQTIYVLMHAGWRKGIEQFTNYFWCGMYGGRECAEGELEANAQLIAAAPDLLAACEEALTLILDVAGDYTNICDCPTCKAADVLRAAIKLAKGE